MKSIRRVLGVALAAMVGATTAGIATAAHAETGWDRCPHGSFCLFSELNGEGTIAIFSWGSPDLRQQGLDDHVWGSWNRGARPAVGWPDYNYNGTSLWYAPAYSGPGNFGEFAATRMSSAKFVD